MDSRHVLCTEIAQNIYFQYLMFRIYLQSGSLFSGRYVDIDAF